jgi:hypothetical protein
MTGKPDDLELMVRNHEKAIFLLVDFLMMRCPDRYDAEMDRHVEAVKESFQQLRVANPRLCSELRRDMLLTHALGHNYAIAQCSTLLAFAHQVTRLNDQFHFSALDEPIESLWRRVERTFDQFFSSPFPKERR